MNNYSKLTFRELLDQSRKLYSQRPALSFIGEKPITYEELYIAARNISGIITTLGIKKGDKIILLGENSPNWGIAYFAISTIGAVVVPILTDFSEAEVEKIIKHSEAKLIFVSSKFFSKIKGLDIQQIEAVILLNNFDLVDSKDFDPQTVTNYSIPTSKHFFPDDYIFSVPDEDELLSIIYTSGTTGRPKGVMLTHKNILSNIIATLKIQPVVETDRLLSILPLPHTYECTIGFLLPMFCGASVYYLPKPPTAAVLLPAMEIVKPTMILSVPLVIEKIFRNKILPELTSSPLKKRLYHTNFGRKFMHKIASKKLQKAFGGHIHFFGVGGAKLSYEVEQFMFEGKFPYSIGYGMTETSPLLSGCTPRIVRFRCAGFALPGQEMKIHNINPETGEGEIVVKGDNNMVGYFKEPELTKDIYTEDGWLKTGDLGAMDKDGYVEIKGRLKNMILGPSGENIYPEEIEEVINSHELVIESIVYELKGKLVARVHLNIEELENKYEHLRNSAKSINIEEIEKKYENLKNTAKNIQQNFEVYLDDRKEEIRQYVNSKVSGFSKLNTVVVQIEPFEKTPTQKIKRFLYTNRL